jgi:hypothetical protein
LKAPNPSQPKPKTKKNQPKTGDPRDDKRLSSLFVPPVLYHIDAGSLAQPLHAPPKSTTMQPERSSVTGPWLLLLLPPPSG